MSSTSLILDFSSPDYVAPLEPGITATFLDGMVVRVRERRYRVISGQPAVGLYQALVEPVAAGRSPRIGLLESPGPTMDLEIFRGSGVEVQVIKALGQVELQYFPGLAPSAPILRRVHWTRVKIFATKVVDTQ